MIIVSIVSHKNNQQVENLLKQFEKLYIDKNIIKFVITFNISKDIVLKSNYNLNVNFIFNKVPKGFSANHNSAFKKYVNNKEDYYMILNPDVELIKFNINELLHFLSNANPKAIFYPRNLFYKKLSSQERNKLPGLSIIDYILSPDKNIRWVSGEAMIFKANWYQFLGGFDEAYFLYVEDVDICFRNQANGGSVIPTPMFIIKHEGAKKSHKNFIYFIKHIRSLLKFYFNLSKRKLP